MARIQLYESGIAPAQTTGARYQAQDYGPGIGGGVARLGEAMGQAAEVVNRIGELHDDAAVKEATNGLNQWYAEAAYTGQNAYFTKKGKDALETRPMIEKGLAELVKQRRGSLQNERQQRLFDDAVNPQQIQWQTQIANHAANETITYAANESDARAGMTAEMAGLTYLDNPAEGEKHIATLKAEIAAGQHLKGAGPDTIAAAQLKATSSVYHDIGMQIAASGPQGWDLAREFAKQHGGDMTDDTRRAILDKADIEQHSFEAEQRRVASEQRRMEREAKTDAKDRVESGMVRIEQGLPLKPDEYASILSDARATGDVNLIKRVEEGQFTNSLSIQHQNDTPYQLQARVNDLSTRIARSGADAKPEDLLERDHLQKMLGSSREQLKSNPLAWGANHLGLDVKPLILGNPASVRSRIATVRDLAKRTGMAVAPLQPDEVAAAQTAFNTGTVQQKVDMTLKLSAFGSYAGAAVEQITNNPALINVAGLATHSNRAVAASRVNQIFTGFEALKAMPKLVKEDDARRQFSDFTGNALQFLPQVKAGVYANAKALLASTANEHGWTEWPEAQNEWQSAVNSALGAYMRDGKRYGGLWTYNGGTTVLPENMTGTEFEDRIAKAHGPEFRQAQNGEPVFGGGRSPTATDIKRMQWVPSGDGIYRLTDGNGFLHTKTGDLYEIDVGKLHSFDAQLAAHGYSRH